MRLSRKSRTQAHIEELTLGSSVTADSEHWEDDLVAPIIAPAW